MSGPVVYLAQAENDIVQAHDSYAEHSPGLGERFLDSVREIADNIRDNPEMYGVFRRNIRAVPLKRFPYVM